MIQGEASDAVGSSTATATAEPSGGALYFVGVTTGGSSIMRLFPVWADLLGLDARIVGYDLPLGAAPEQYRECVDALTADPAFRGALVTTHKAAIYDHAAPLFTQLDPHAELCREVSCIARRESGLAGWAKDPITAGQALDHLLGEDYWRGHGGHAVCFGAGGAGLAIAVRLLAQDDAPDTVVLVDRDQRRLDLAREVCAQLDVSTPLELVLAADTATSDDLVSRSPERSVIINATGMGKDLPGAPITEAARFPGQSVAWDLNYRGDLEFLRLAELQSAERGVRVSDGWRYFLHGWTEVIAEVFEIDLTTERFDRLAAAAAELSGRTEPRRDQS